MLNITGVVYDLQGYLLVRRYVTSSLRHVPGVRGEIQGFSIRSGSRMRRYLRTCLADYTVLATLTYPAGFPTNGAVCKTHLKNFVARYRRHITDEGKFSCFWFLEFQERGAPHFHLFLTHPLHYETVARLWYEVVGSDDVRHFQAGTRIEKLRSGRYGTCCYATKYAAKHSQKIVPKGFECVGRFWGVYGRRECMAATLLFPADKLDTAGFREFRAGLKRILEKWHGSIKESRLYGNSRGILLRSPALVTEIAAYFHRQGTLLWLQGTVFFEYPTRGIDLEEW